MGIKTHCQQQLIYNTVYQVRHSLCMGIFPKKNSENDKLDKYLSLKFPNGMQDIQPDYIKKRTDH